MTFDRPAITLIPDTMKTAPVRHSIVLLGMKHSGKTSLGRRLAERWGVTFKDLDDIVEQLFDPARTLSCREIYRLYGLEYFSELETKAATQLTEEMATAVLVAALGGGTIENTSAMNALKDRALKVYLRDDPSVLFERIMRNGLPAFLDAGKPRTSFDSLYARRTALFEKEADLTIAIDGKGLEEAFGMLLDAVEEQL